MSALPSLNSDSAPVSIRGRFRRSVDLARDVHAGAALDGYVVTTTARSTLDRLLRGIAEPEAARAWSVVGPYGGGKSAFALFAARLVEGRADARARLQSADADLAVRADATLTRPLCAVLVGGAREGLPQALVRGLARAAETGAFAEALKPLRSHARDLLARFDESPYVPDETVLALFEQAAALVHASAGGGLFVVVDELGKLLEHAALDPAGGDLFLLQRLAERAARSEAAAGRPLMLVLTILHQAFERYAGRLSAEQREEWRKVQGRFEDVSYAEPVDETLRLLAEAIHVNPDTRFDADPAGVVEAVLAAARPVATLVTPAARDHLLHAFPLHPAVSLLVGPLFRRMAQNERTLFAFLASGEPGGFLDVVREQGGRVGLYRLDHLFDYLTDTLGASLAHGDIGKLWAETQVALHRLSDADALQVRLLKSIALLNFAGELAGLSASPALLAACADAPPRAVEEALEALRSAKVVIYHRAFSSYRLWQGSDFDLDARLAEVRATLPAMQPLAEMLAEALPPVPVVARRHSYVTGTTRAFAVAYCTETSWRAEVRRFREQAEREEDGLILYILPETIEASALLDDLPAALAEVAGEELIFAAVPYGVGALREAVKEWQAVSRLREEAQAELDGDRAARQEVEMRRGALESQVKEGFARLIEPNADGEIPCSWVKPAGHLGRMSGRRLQALLSAACDTRFPDTPAIWNELINRRKPSASAMSGLKALLVAMLEASDKPDLGFQGYPAAFGLYASVVQALGMHRQDEAGNWQIVPPDPRHRGARAAWEHLSTRLQSTSGSPLIVRELYTALQAPPFGMKEGVCPVFLLAFIKHHEEEIAVFCEGRFLPSLGIAEIELLLKVPEKFSVQWVALSGARAQVVRAIAPLAGVPETVREPLPVVVGLIRQARELPRYTQSTASLSDRALAVREAMRHAAEPATLLFAALLQACGLPSFLSDEATPRDAERLAEKLREAWEELAGAYPALLHDLERQLGEKLHLNGPNAEARRRELAQRARPLLSLTTYAPLKAFLIRAADERLDWRPWIESIGALLGKRPPVMWVDADKATFAAGLRDIARRFHTLEPLTFETEASEPRGDGMEQEGFRVRLGVTQPHEPEVEGVVALDLFRIVAQWN